MRITCRDAVGDCLGEMRLPQRGAIDHRAIGASPIHESGAAVTPQMIQRGSENLCVASSRLERDRRNTPRAGNQ
jgi:hypothetical protein